MPYQFLQFAIAPEDRALLHQRIEQRFHKMIELGFQEEVEKLYQREDLYPDLPSIRCVGYRQMWEYLRGDYDHEEDVYKRQTPDCPTKMDVPSLKSEVNFSIFFPVSAEMMMV